MLNTRQKIINNEYNKKPNNAIANACLVFAAVMLFVLVFNELGIFLAGKIWVRIASYSSIILMLIPKMILLIPGVETKHSTKYFIIAIVTLVSMISCVCLNFHSTLVIFFPIFSAMLYCDKKMGLIFSVIALVICFSYPLISLAIGSWNYEFFIWLAFGKADKLDFFSQFARFSSFKEVALFVSLPNSAILVGFETIAYFYISNASMSIENNIIVSEMKEKDHLTGLYNQNTYYSFVSETKPGALYGVLMFDVNNLKITNDRYGHLAGDELLCDCALSIENILDEKSVAFRLGGDEFVAVFELDTRADIMSKLHAWEDSFEKVKAEKARDFSCSMSVGFSTGDSENLAETIKSADEKMYIAKRKFHEND